MIFFSYNLSFEREVDSSASPKQKRRIKFKTETFGLCRIQCVLVLPPFRFNCRSREKNSSQNKCCFIVSMLNLLTRFSILFFYWLQYG